MRSTERLKLYRRWIAIAVESIQRQPCHQPPARMCHQQQLVHAQARFDQSHQLVCILREVLKGIVLKSERRIGGRRGSVEILEALETARRSSMHKNHCLPCRDYLAVA